MEPIIFVINEHQVSVWNIQETVWLSYLPWMRYCPWMLVRIDGRYATGETFDELR